MPLELIVLLKRHIHTLRSSISALHGLLCRGRRVKNLKHRWFAVPCHTAFHSRRLPVNKSAGIRGDSSEYLPTMHLDYLVIERHWADSVVVVTTAEICCCCTCIITRVPFFQLQFVRRSQNLFPVQVPLAHKRGKCVPRQDSRKVLDTRQFQRDLHMVVSIEEELLLAGYRG